MLIRVRRSIHIVLFCAAMTFLASCIFVGGVNARITDISGRSYEVGSVRLTGDNIRIVCGETRMDVPLKSVSVMRVTPSRIVSVDGRPHYGVEVTLSDSTVIGGAVDGGENCVVCSDNGFRGKISKKTGYNAPFGDIINVEVLVKEKGQKKAADGKEGEDGESEE
ncbi:MAG: hypothetical protein FWB85_00365 [Chitinispirillia bacterium]|nr:hypothetical protein [Chitinispirillia bacterium]MCL2240959.1 hypothetical protein [Chitinispirillia bacterium]